MGSNFGVLSLGLSSKYKDPTWRMLQLPNDNSLGDKEMTTGCICGHSDSTRSQTLARFHLLHGFCNLHPNYGALMMC